MSTQANTYLSYVPTLCPVLCPACPYYIHSYAHCVPSPAPTISALHSQPCAYCVPTVPHTYVIVTWLALCPLWPSPMLIGLPPPSQGEVDTM